MELESRFEVPAAPDEVWAFLEDIARVVPCLPGARIVEAVSDDEFRMSIDVKLGAVSLRFAATVRREVAAVGRELVLRTSAREVRGQGWTEGRMQVELTPAGAGTAVQITTNVLLRGNVLQYSRGLLPEVSRQLTEEFARAATRELTPGRR